MGIRARMAKQQAKKERPLTALQERFCYEYIIDGVGYAAVKRAGYRSKRPEVQASQLRNIPKVKAKIAELQALAARRNEISADKVIGELSKLAFANIQDYIEGDNQVVDISTLPRDIAAAVQSVEVDIRHDSGDSKGYTERVKFKMADKNKNLESLGRHLGLFEADNNQKRQATQINVLYFHQDTIDGDGGNAPAQLPAS